MNINFKSYHEIVSEIHAPQELERKVLDMKNHIPETEYTMKKKKKSVKYRKSIAAAIAICMILLCSNGIVYATTGLGIIDNVRIFINGNSYEETMKERVIENGDKEYTISVNDIEMASFILTSNPETLNQIILAHNNKSENEFNEKKHIYLTVQYGTLLDDVNYHSDENTESSTNTTTVSSKSVMHYDPEHSSYLIYDITDDFIDGIAEVVCGINSQNIHYTVTGTIENYSIDIKTE